MRPVNLAGTNGVDLAASRESALARVLDGYLAAVEAGESVDPEALVTAHPEIAERLRSCLAVLRVASRVEGSADLGAEFDPSLDNRLGDFRILRMIGRGGMGIVFEAEQISLHRRVALKVLPFAAALDPQQLRRFQIEAQAAALLHHSNLVPIFSVGCERGVHYYAMQYIKGQTLASLIGDLCRLARSEAHSTASVSTLAVEIASGRLGPSGAGFDRILAEPPAKPRNGRIRHGRRSADPAHAVVSAVSARTDAYFRTVAHLGLQAAEALDYAHRQGVIHRDIKPANLLIDVHGNLWVTDFGLARMQADSSLTMTGDILGTLRYMSPEQSSARRGIVDHRTDIYSLGATLYELLALRPAYDGRDRDELLTQMAFAEPRSPRSWNPAVPRDLETIVLKALARDVVNRYATAQDLADDLRRFLDQRPIQARRPNLWKHAEKWARRHKTLAASLIVVATLAVVSGFIVAALSRSHQRLDRITRHAQYVHDIRQAFYLVRQDNLPEAIRLLDRHRPALGKPDDRSFPWYYLWRLTHFEHRILRGHQRDVYHVEFSPDGQTLASSGKDGTVRLWDPTTGQLQRILRGHDGDVNYAAFSPDGRSLATGGDDGTVRLWDAASGQRLATLGKHTDWVNCVLFTPDGQRLISGAKDKRVKIWDIPTTREQASLTAPAEIEALALSRDGRTLFTGGWDGSVRLWDLATLREKLKIPGLSRIQSVSLSHDGRSVATADVESMIRVWETASGRLKASLSGHTRVLERVAFSPDDRLLAACGGDGTVRLWDLATRRFRKIWSGPRYRVWSVAFSPAGHTLAFSTELGEVELSDLSAIQGMVSIPIPSNSIQSMAYSGTGETLTVFAVDKGDGIIAVLDPGRRELLDQRPVHSKAGIFHGALSPDGKRLATMDADQMVTLRDVENGLPLKSLAVRGLVPWGDVAFSPDGRYLAVTSINPSAVLCWDTQSGVARQFPSHEFNRVRFVPGGDSILVHNPNGLFRVDLVAGGFAESRIVACAGLEELALSADGRMLATGEGNGMIKLWDVRSLEHEASLLGHGEKVTGLAWAPDGKTLASTSLDGTARLWDVAARQELGIIDDDAARDLKLQFSPDGSFLSGYGGAPNPEVVLWPAPRDGKPSR